VGLDRVLEWVGEALRRVVAAAATAVLGAAAGAVVGGLLGVLGGALGAAAHGAPAIVLPVGAHCAVAGAVAGALVGGFGGWTEGRVLGASLLRAAFRRRRPADDAAPPESAAPEGQRQPDWNGKEQDVHRMHSLFGAPHGTAAPWWMKRP
jgi:hypothetical protein